MKLRGSARFTVQPGEEWALGRHRLRCGDLLEPATREWFPQPDWVYSDPPWGPGNAKFWRTANDQGDFPVDYDALLKAFAEVAHRARIGAFVEMGMRWRGELEGAMQWTPSHTWTTVYGKPPRPNLVQFYPRLKRVPGIVPGDPTGMTGESVVTTLLGGLVQPGDVIVDPCMGLGMTLRVGHHLGATVWGNELHPRRMERCLDWAHRNGLNVEKVTT